MRKSHEKANLHQRLQAMAQNKTTPTTQSVAAFLEAFVDNEAKKADARALIEHMEAWTGETAKMWGPSIIGFGSYHYVYASGHAGDAPVVAFSPRKAALTLYVYSETERSKAALAQLGKFKMSKACIYVKRLADIDLQLLRLLCEESIRYISEHHVCSCRLPQA